MLTITSHVRSTSETSIVSRRLSKLTLSNNLLTLFCLLRMTIFKEISFEITHNFQRIFKLKIFTLLFHSWLMSIWATNDVSWISKFTFKSDNLVGRFWIGVITFSFFFFDLSIGPSKSLGVECLKVELEICMSTKKI